MGSQSQVHAPGLSRDIMNEKQSKPLYCESCGVDTKIDKEYHISYIYPDHNEILCKFCAGKPNIKARWKKAWKTIEH